MRPWWRDIKKQYLWNWIINRLIFNWLWIVSLIFTSPPLWYFLSAVSTATPTRPPGPGLLAIVLIIVLTVLGRNLWSFVHFSTSWHNCSNIQRNVGKLFPVKPQTFFYNEFQSKYNWGFPVGIIQPHSFCGHSWSPLQTSRYRDDFRVTVLKLSALLNENCVAYPETVRFGRQEEWQILILTSCHNSSIFH